MTDPPEDDLAQPFARRRQISNKVLSEEKLVKNEILSFYLARHAPTKDDLARTTLPVLCRRIARPAFRRGGRRLRNQMQHNRACQLIMCVPASFGRLEDVNRVPGSRRRCR